MNCEVKSYFGRWWQEFSKSLYSQGRFSQDVHQFPLIFVGFLAFILAISYRVSVCLRFGERLVGKTENGSFTGKLKVLLRILMEMKV